MVDKPWSALDVVQWTYLRAEGDIEIWARTKDEVIQTLRQHGFIIVDVAQIRQTSAKRSLAEMLAKKQESERGNT